jgi:hypothetical protein
LHTESQIYEYKLVATNDFSHLYGQVVLEHCPAYTNVWNSPASIANGCPQILWAGNSMGNYSLTLLHSFDSSDGATPLGEVVRTTKGTLFGTTVQGGSGSACTYGCGTAWSYVP